MDYSPFLLLSKEQAEMRECPTCGYVDPPYWRNRLFDYEVDICQIQDVYTMDSDLYLELISAKQGSTIFKSPYCYRLTKTGWVYRIWESLFKVRGWSPQKYYDGAGSKASALRKMNLQAYGKK
jgi:hypothetical protein